MFFIFGTKKKVRPVDGGKRIREKCPSCGHDSQFVECEATASLDFYFIDVMEDVTRVWVCTLCQEQFSVEKQDQTEVRAKRVPEPEDAPARVQPQKRPAYSAPIPSRSERAAMAKSSEIEDRLAALKRKMGPK